MAEDAYTYGVVAGVELRAGWAVASRTFGASTIPTTTQVEGVLDQVASRIHMKLAQLGYPLKTKTDLTTVSAILARWLAALNEDGAAAEILMTYATARDPETGENHPASHYTRLYSEGMKMIGGSFLSDLGLTKDRESSRQLIGTSVKDVDGNYKYPTFKRTMLDYPGARSRAGTEQNSE